VGPGQTIRSRAREPSPPRAAPPGAQAAAPRAGELGQVPFGSRAPAGAHSATEIWLRARAGVVQGLQPVDGSGGARAAASSCRCAISPAGIGSAQACLCSSRAARGELLPSGQRERDSVQVRVWRRQGARARRGRDELLPGVQQECGESSPVQACARPASAAMAAMGSQIPRANGYGEGQEVVEGVKDEDTETSAATI
jgi:hypothetical protein